MAEPSKDFLQIPAHRTTADTVLNWDVFDGKYPPMALIGVLFSRVEDGAIYDGGPMIDHVTPAGGLMPVNEEHIPLLVDKFLENVHTKNPVLDVEQLVKQARTIAGQGLGWDGWSCLVLLASALGTVAKPFESAVNVAPSPGLERVSSPTWITDAPTTPKELQQAESYFTLATRRIGSLKHSILGAQCYFFAGVYLMYTLRPLLSWQYFIQASHLYQLYMKTTHGLAADISQLNQLPIQRPDIPDGKRRRLEESLYWSCFKSESEFRVELPLPQSEISNYQHPQMFPSPPSPAGGEEDQAQDQEHLNRVMSHDSTLGSMPPLVKSHSQTTEELDLREHAKKLCNEEESWYYYLTEIALRRIGNRIINTFFNENHDVWLDIRPLLGIALEFDTQVSAWSAHLPAAMQHWETNYTIRAPGQSSLRDGSGNHVSRELSWATDNRLLEMRSWLFQPFLYYFIHRLPPVTPFGSSTLTGSIMFQQPTQEDFVSMATYHANPKLSIEDATALYHFITSGVGLNLKILDVRSLRHRHHGLWYDMRSIMTAALILLAIVKSGHEAWIPGGPDILWGISPQSLPHDHPVEGKIGHAMSEFDFWAIESPDLRRHRDVLEDVTKMVRQVWIDRKSR